MRRKKGGEEKKSNGCTLSFYHGYLGDSFWPKKKLALTFSKIRLEIYSQLNSPCLLGYRGF